MHVLRTTVRTAGPPLALILAVLAAWEAWVRLADVDGAVLPAPSAVARALVDQAGVLAGHSLTTLGETAVGLMLGAALGVGVAVATTLWTPVRRAVMPLVVALQTIPPIVLAPLLVLVLGFGWGPRIVVVVGVVFFPVAIAGAGAMRDADPARVELVRSFGVPPRRILRLVLLPGAMPAMFDGLRIAAAYAVGAAAVAEQIGGARSGLGLFIARSQRNFRADQVLAGVAVIAGLSLAVYALVGLTARRVMPWHRPALDGARP